MPQGILAEGPSLDVCGRRVNLNGYTGDRNTLLTFVEKRVLKTP